jgi:UDP-N-acetylglucosamine 2-epimerase (non-hydrolysing)
MAAPLRVLAVVGTRPNFMKVAPVLAALTRRGPAFSTTLVHTGQHYDEAMSDVFLQDLGVGPPDHVLGVGSGTHAQQTARVLERMEEVLVERRPDVVLVPGDVNSTLGAALATAKAGIPLGHIEAGLRSFDRTMPEEVNRVLTDAVSDLLFVHSPEAVGNLVREGIDPARIHSVGNTMIDSLVATRPRIDAAGARDRIGLRAEEYVVVTLHRPALVDGPLLAETLGALEELAARLPVVFPVHPRTRRAIDRLAPNGVPARVRLLEPLGYLDFMSLLVDAAAVVTDSGGIQEETTFLGIPCFTLRANTERPITCTVGTNVLLGLDPRGLGQIGAMLDRSRRRTAPSVPLWDGRASERIVDVLERELVGR